VDKEAESAEPKVRVVDRRWWARPQTEEAGQTEAETRKPAYVEELEKRIAELTSQLRELTAERRRSLDDFEQAKGRIRREVAREVERTRRGMLVDLLEVVDNLDRAMTAARQAESADPLEAFETLAQGIDLVRRQFLTKLDAFGVARVAALGQPFEAARHEAVMTTPVEEASQDGIVTAVLKEGYAIGDAILRPASVAVGRYVAVQRDEAPRSPEPET
jgi:molecular chaperone GrpE